MTSNQPREGIDGYAGKDFEKRKDEDGQQHEKGQRW